LESVSKSVSSYSCFYSLFSYLFGWCWCKSAILLKTSLFCFFFWRLDHSSVFNPIPR
jgi:hypothetical protein